MYYSAIGILALLILLIENQDILLNRNGAFDQPAWKVYRRFLFSVLVYYASDILWGILESRKRPQLLFIDTTVYFIAMAAGILFWTQYAVTYLEEKNAFSRFLVFAGRILAVLVALIAGVNVFVPVLFAVDDQCVYKALPVRYAVLLAQILLLLLISVYALSSYIRRRAEKRRLRYRTLALFGLCMAVFLGAQIWFPYLPLYSIAYMLGLCLLRAFVIGDEKKMDAQRLAQAQSKASIDALTGVKNRHAYLDAEEQMDLRIEQNNQPPFAIVILDVNDLKRVNDSSGHQAGDQYLRSACTVICNIFKHSPVFRIGGDEFLVIAQGSDYAHIGELLGKVYDHNTDASAAGGVVIACGMARYEQDPCVAPVFERADQNMYENKLSLKAERMKEN